MLVGLVKQIAEQKGTTPARVALAWLLAQKPWIVPIFGTRNSQRLEENLGAVEVTLSQDVLRHIDKAMSGMSLQGAGTLKKLKKIRGVDESDFHKLKC